MNVTSVNSNYAFSVLANRPGSSGNTYAQMIRDLRDSSPNTFSGVRNYTLQMERANQQALGILAHDVMVLENRVKRLEKTSEAPHP